MFKYYNRNEIVQANKRSKKIITPNADKALEALAKRQICLTKVQLLLGEIPNPDPNEELCSGLNQFCDANMISLDEATDYIDTVYKTQAKKLIGVLNYRISTIR